MRSPEMAVLEDVESELGCRPDGGVAAVRALKARVAVLEKTWPTTDDGPLSDDDLAVICHHVAHMDGGTLVAQVAACALELEELRARVPELEAERAKWLGVDAISILRYERKWTAYLERIIDTAAIERKHRPVQRGEGEKNG